MVQNSERSNGANRPVMRCDTTLAARRPREDCICDTEQDELGPCDSWEQGMSGNCVYCEHARVCHWAEAKTLATMHFKNLGVNLLVGKWFRPSWLRYEADGYEYGTLRIGIAQIKWTRRNRK
jgi:hypothetical protein